MSSEVNPPNDQKLEDLEAPAQDLSAEETATVSGGFFKNAKKAKTSEAVTFVPPTDVADE